MSDRPLSEQDVTTKLVIPALTRAGWDLDTQIREQYSFTDGRIIVRGKVVRRGERKRVDILLFYKSHYPIAVIEVKDQSHGVGDGMQQALGYAEPLDAPFAYSTNGAAFLEHDRVSSGTIEQELSLENFPSPADLFARWAKSPALPQGVGAAFDEPYLEEAKRGPRYFQEIAVNRTINAVAQGKKRLLLVMATGTGKTYTAFQIIWRLWKSRTAKRVLFLVDRNVLADDPIRKDFKHFGKAMTKIEGHNVDKAYEIYIALYQGITGNEEENNIFKQFSPDFFDLIVVDECHRGSARDNSAWRGVLEYYSSAVQIGLTATPREEKDASTHDYFGEPLYTYSLKQGIEDGFLAPYKVIRVVLDLDVEGYRPVEGARDKYGNEIPDATYKGPDFERTIVIDERTKAVAHKLGEFLKATDPMQKTIVFCQDIDHAERMRQALVNELADQVRENSRYLVRITGDNDEGKKELDNFMDPASPYPVVVTTSKLLTTGVDVQTCKLIVLDANINSMTEFKQIIGRGTRVREDYGKLYFTIMDFRGVTELFADPAFDGEPVVIYRPKEGDPPVPPEDEEGGTDTPVVGEGPFDGDIIKDGPAIVDYPPEAVRKYYISGVPVSVIHERVQFVDENGKLVSEQLVDYTKRNILGEYQTLQDFLSAWSSAERKEAVIEELESRGVFFEALAEEVGRDLDPFDLVCHIAYGREPMTRQARAKRAKTAHYFEQYEGKAREVIDALFAKYADQGITAIDDIADLVVSPFNEIGSAKEIVDLFGGREKYLDVVRQVQEAIYGAS